MVKLRILRGSFWTFLSWGYLVVGARHCRPLNSQLHWRAVSSPYVSIRRKSLIYTDGDAVNSAHLSPLSRFANFANVLEKILRYFVLIIQTKVREIALFSCKNIWIFECLNVCLILLTLEENALMTVLCKFILTLFCSKLFRDRSSSLR